MTHKDLANLIFPNITKTIEDYEKMYPERDLPEGAMVTRFAPSPTGFVHMGRLYASFSDIQFAKQTDGVFFLRIEDTDQKRQVENGVRGIVDDLKNFKIEIDEGMLTEEDETLLFLAISFSVPFSNNATSALADFLIWHPIRNRIGIERKSHLFSLRFTSLSEVPQAEYSDIFYTIPVCPSHGKVWSSASKCGNRPEHHAAFSYRGC